jgi:hypothetical protein
VVIARNGLHVLGLCSGQWRQGSRRVIGGIGGGGASARRSDAAAFRASLVLCGCCCRCFHGV